MLVEGVNRIKKHTAQSANERGASSGGIVTQEAPIHVSNVMVVDSTGKPTRVGYRTDDESGKRVRIAKTNGKGHLNMTKHGGATDRNTQPWLKSATAKRSGTR